MTRNASAELTSRTAAQHDALKDRMKAGLARRVLDVVGVRHVDGGPHVATADLWAHEAALLALLGNVKACYTAKERQRLYKNNEHLGTSVAKLVLGGAGHPLTRPNAKRRGKALFALDPALLAADPVADPVFSLG